MDNDEITRRDFVSMTVGAGIVAATGAEASAQQRVVETNVEIKTADGVCDAAFIHPANGARVNAREIPSARVPTSSAIIKRSRAEGFISSISANL